MESPIGYWKPDGVEVEIYDFDELFWLSRDDRYELMSRLESGDDRLATLALHLAEDHYWEGQQTELAALPKLHAEHHQTDCGHEHEESEADS